MEEDHSPHVTGQDGHSDGICERCRERFEHNEAIIRKSRIGRFDTFSAHHENTYLCL